MPRAGTLLNEEDYLAFESILEPHLGSEPHTAPARPSPLHPQCRRGRVKAALGHGLGGYKILQTTHLVSYPPMDGSCTKLVRDLGDSREKVEASVDQEPVIAILVRIGRGFLPALGEARREPTPLEATLTRSLTHGSSVWHCARQNETVEQYHKAIHWGIDCIQTDHPLRVLRAIELLAAKKPR